MRKIPANGWHLVKEFILLLIGLCITFIFATFFFYGLYEWIIG